MLNCKYTFSLVPTQVPEHASTRFDLPILVPDPCSSALPSRRLVRARAAVEHGTSKKRFSTCNGAIVIDNVPKVRLTGNPLSCGLRARHDPPLSAHPDLR